MKWITRLWAIDYAGNGLCTYVKYTMDYEYIMNNVGDGMNNVCDGLVCMPIVCAMVMNAKDDGWN